MAHKDFSVAISDKIRDRPSFRLQGVDFLCKPGLSWKSMSRITEAVNDAGSDPDAIQKAVLDFFDVVLVKTARPKMHDLIEADEDDDDDDAVPLGLDELLGVIQWLVEQYTGTPTTPSDTSSSSPSDTGEESKADTSTDTVSDGN